MVGSVKHTITISYVDGFEYLKEGDEVEVALKQPQNPTDEPEIESIKLPGGKLIKYKNSIKPHKKNSKYKGWDATHNDHHIKAIHVIDDTSYILIWDAKSKKNNFLKASLKSFVSFLAKILCIDIMSSKSGSGGGYAKVS